MKKYYPILKNPDGCTSNFFIHTTFDPLNEMKNRGVQSFIVKKIPKEDNEYAGLILGEVDELIGIQKTLDSNGWQRVPQLGH